MDGRWHTRRGALRCLGVAGVTAVAGCATVGRGTDPTHTGDPASSDSPTHTGEPTSFDSPTSSSEGDSVQRRISLAEQDTVPEERALSITVELLRSRVTASETAKLRVTLTNKGDPQGLKIGPGDCFIFNRGYGGSVHPEGLWLHLPPNRQVERKTGQWTRNRDPDKPRYFPRYACGVGRIERGESIQEEYAVWDDYRVDGYMEPDTYRFERDITVYKKEQEEWKPNATFTWGFSLTVEEPSG